MGANQRGRIECSPSTAPTASPQTAGIDHLTASIQRERERETLNLLSTQSMAQNVKRRKATTSKHEESTLRLTVPSLSVFQRRSARRHRTASGIARRPRHHRIGHSVLRRRAKEPLHRLQGHSAAIPSIERIDCIHCAVLHRRRRLTVGSAAKRSVASTEWLIPIDAASRCHSHRHSLSQRIDSLSVPAQ